MGYIVIDSGTTNTRIRLVENKKVLGEFKEKTGARNVAMNGNDTCLRDCIKRGIEICLNHAGRNMKDIEAIFATGMITSNNGLHEIPHLEAPVGLEDLKKGMEICSFNDIVDMPILFIPGVKNKVVDDVFDTDMMRGEETEVFGAKHLSGLEGELIYISPGSHTKFVFIDHEERIEKCSTTLAGEILWALSKETVLTDSLPETLITEVDREYIIKGMRTVEKHGFSKTCFMTRILDVFTDSTDNQRVNFLMAAICYHDMKSIEADLVVNKRVLIGGAEILRNFYFEMLDIWGYDMDNVFKLDNDLVEFASASGVQLIKN